MVRQIWGQAPSPVSSVTVTMLLKSLAALTFSLQNGNYRRTYFIG